MKNMEKVTINLEWKYEKIEKKREKKKRGNNEIHKSVIFEPRS